MATYYFVIAEDDMWWVRVRGRTYGGFLLRGHAVKQALHSARKCQGEAHVVVQEPHFRWRIEWSNQSAPMQMPITIPTPPERDGLAAG